MSADIKPGDLVMVVRPTHCCGNTSRVGMVGVIEDRPSWAHQVLCVCGRLDNEVQRYLNLNGGGIRIDRLKKLDPPEHGDSLPTRTDLEMPA